MIFVLLAIAVLLVLVFIGAAQSGAREDRAIAEARRHERQLG